MFKLFKKKIIKEEIKDKSQRNFDYILSWDISIPKIRNNDRLRSLHINIEINEDGKLFIYKELDVFLLKEDYSVHSLDEKDFYKKIDYYINMTDEEMDNMVIDIIKESIKNRNIKLNNKEDVENLMIKLNRKGSITIK